MTTPLSKSERLFLAGAMKSMMLAEGHLLNRLKKIWKA